MPVCILDRDILLETESWSCWAISSSQNHARNPFIQADERWGGAGDSVGETSTLYTV